MHTRLALARAPAAAAPNLGPTTTKKTSHPKPEDSQVTLAAPRLLFLTAVLTKIDSSVSISVNKL
jgi:hypothetical protein